MRVWIPPVIVAFGLGATLGLATKSPAPENVSVQTHGNKMVQHSAPSVPVVDHFQSSPPSVARLLPKVLIADDLGSLTPRQHALRAILEVVPRIQLQRALPHAIWGDPEMERKALALFRQLKDPKERDLFVELEILELVSDPAVRAELAAWTRTERDPSQRRRLASIVGSIWQSEKFLTLIEELLADADPSVASAAFGRHPRTDWSEVGKEPERKLRWTRAIQSLAAPMHSKDVRLRAIRALRGAKDETTTQELMRAALSDPDNEVVAAAIDSLPEADDLPNTLAVGMIRMLYAMATDETRPASVRSAAALAADMNDRYGEDKILTPAEQELIERIRDSWREE